MNTTRILAICASFVTLFWGAQSCQPKKESDEVTKTTTCRVTQTQEAQVVAGVAFPGSTTYKFTYDPTNKMVILKEAFSSGSVISKTEYTYLSDGRMSKWTYYFGSSPFQSKEFIWSGSVLAGFEDKDGDGVTTSKTLYTYNSNNLLVTAVKYTNMSAGSSNATKDSIVYTNFTGVRPGTATMYRKSSSASAYSNNGREEMTYDNEGNMLTKTSYNSSNVAYQEYRYTYDNTFSTATATKVQEPIPASLALGKGQMLTMDTYQLVTCTGGASTVLVKTMFATYTYGARNSNNLPSSVTYVNQSACNTSTSPIGLRTTYTYTCD